MAPNSNDLTAGLIGLHSLEPLKFPEIHVDKQAPIFVLDAWVLSDALSSLSVAR